MVAALVIAATADRWRMVARAIRSAARRRLGRL
jgi:hypothetical protein